MSNSILDLSERLQALAAAIDNKKKQMVAEQKSYADARTSEVEAEILREFGVFQKKKLEEFFRNSVREFYADYTPHFYGRKLGLYQTMDIQFNEDGYVDDDDVGSLYDASKMHSGRGGYSGAALFEKTFVEGYHGGAESGPGHPSPGTPYYRWHCEWTRPAIKTTSPKELFENSVDGLGGTVMDTRLKIIAESWNNKVLKPDIEEKITELNNKYFGEFF